MGQENLDANEQQYYSSEKLRTQATGNGLAKTYAEEIAYYG